MRRDEKKAFKVTFRTVPPVSLSLISIKGSVFTEFREFDSVDKFLNADPKPSWSGQELLIMTK
jgi:hypothetical protein